MARMIGKSQWHQQCPYGCCVGWKDKTTTKREEEVLWRKESEEEITFSDIERHIGADGYCCSACRDEYTGALGEPQDLEFVEGVTFGQVRSNGA